jgi:hypothetical protein
MENQNMKNFPGASIQLPNFRVCNDGFLQLPLSYMLPILRMFYYEKACCWNAITSKFNIQGD